MASLTTRPLTLAAALFLATRAALAAEPLLDLSSVTFEGPDPKIPAEYARKTPAGPAFSFDLGNKHTAWNNARWNVVALPAPKDLRNYSGIKLTVKTDKPRADAGVYLAIREADGSWYYYPWACNLTAAANTGEASFDFFTPAEWMWPHKTERDRQNDKAAEAARDEAFKIAAATQPALKKPEYREPPGHFDPNGKLDLDQIDRIAIGVVNAQGVGKVDFTLTSLELVPAPNPAAMGAPIPSVVNVTGKLLDVNGQTTVPAGLFGGFHFKWTVNPKNPADPMGGQDPYAALRLAQDRNINQTPSFGKDSTTWMMINTFGDRSERSPRQFEANWKDSVAKRGSSAAEKAKAADKPLYVEWWNEPYLNWSNKNRIMFDPAAYNLDEATEGGPVKLKSDGTLCPHLKWTQNYDAPPWNWVGQRFTKDKIKGPDGKETEGVERDHWRRGKDASGQLASAIFEPPSWRRNQVKWAPNTDPPRDVKDGDKYTVKITVTKGKGKDAVKEEKDLELTAVTPWYVYDETQFTFWSASGMSMFYDDPMLVCGQAIKAANPAAIYIAGWDSRTSEDHWDAWHLVYKPTLDAGHDVIDGISDHDYGGEATKMSANYEVITAYGMTKYNKWLKGYNTECAASIDPQAYSGADLSPSIDAVKAVWGARKLMHMLTYVPDKAGSISWFGEGGGFVTETGEGTALKLLKNFRGKLVQVVNPDPAILVAACIDGTDPQNPRPADLPQRKELVVALLNDSPHPRTHHLSITPPTGTSFTGEVITREAPPSDAGQKPRIKETTTKLTGQSFKLNDTLQPRNLVVLTFPLAGDEPAKPEVTRRQSFGPEVVKTVTPAQPLAETIKLDPAALASAKHAWIRFVAERLAADEGVVTLNGKPYPLPPAITPENSPAIRQFPIPLADLKPGDNILIFQANPTHPGYFLGAASIIMERESK